MLKRFVKNETGRDFVIGDLHGCFDQLEAVMELADFDRAKDRLFSVGDLVDRGPKSHHVLHWLDYPWFHSVRGNHEQMAIEADSGQIDPGMHCVNGGLWFYALENCERRDFALAFDHLPYAIEVETDNGTVGLVHAEVPGDDWSGFSDMLDGPKPENFEHYERFALWGRDLIRGRSEFNGVDGVNMVIVGHTPVKEPVFMKNVLYLDTGCCFGKKLTMLCIQGDCGTTYQVDGP